MTETKPSNNGKSRNLDVEEDDGVRPSPYRDCDVSDWGNV
jgi:hypothetical protein